MPLAISNWAERLAGHPVIVFVDNQAALGILRNGTSKAPDLAALAVFTWDLAMRLGIDLTFLWVPSPLNLADPPSRGRRPPAGQPVALAARWEPLMRALLP